MSDITIEQVDQALVHAREQGATDEDLALLWFTRSELVGVAPSPETLMYVMGITEEQALDLVSNLSEKGLIDWTTEKEPDA